MMEHMLKFKWLTDYKFPYAIFVSKLIDCFEVDTKYERNETIKAASEIDNSTLIKMGFHKEDNTWVFRRHVVQQMEHGASNHDHADKDEVAHHMEDEIVQAAKASCYEMHNSSSHRVESPTQPSVHEDVVATNYNALVAY